MSHNEKLHASVSSDIITEEGQGRISQLAEQFNDIKTQLTHFDKDAVIAPYPQQDNRRFRQVSQFLQEPL